MISKKNLETGSQNNSFHYVALVLTYSFKLLMSKYQCYKQIINTVFLLMWEYPQWGMHLGGRMEERKVFILPRWYKNGDAFKIWGL